MKKTYPKLFVLALAILAMNSTAIAQCLSCGNGSDGAYHATTNANLVAGIYNYSSFVIDSGVTVIVTGTDSLVIQSTGVISINGTLIASGGNGSPGVTFSTFGAGGTGVAGGYDGGDGVFHVSTGQISGNAGGGPGGAVGGISWSGSGGGGHAAMGATAGPSVGIGGAAYGNIQMSPVQGGSGGGGGSGGSNCGSGGGGAGGGIVLIQACDSILIGANGGIIAEGGSGGSDGTGNCGAGGGGSGGSIWMSGTTIINNGSISAAGGAGGISTLIGSPYYGTGGIGSDGRIRIDFASFTNNGTTIPAVGFSGAAMAASASGTDVLCHGQLTGMATVSVAGGNAPITYAWTGGGITDSIGNLAAGTYHITVTDSLGCVSMDSVVIAEPDSAVFVTPSVVDVLCNGDSSGNISISVSGGTPGYTYSWSTGDSGTVLSNLPAATYVVTVSDTVGCMDTSFLSLGQPAPLLLSLTEVPATYGNSSDGIAVATPSGGTPPYSIVWNTVPPQNGDSAINLLPGSYTACATDSNGCTFCDSVEVTFLVGSKAMQNFDLTIAPNPANDRVKIKWNQVLDTDLYLRVYDASGKEVARFMEPAGRFAQMELHFGDLPSGMYFLQFTSGDLASMRKLILE